MFNLFYDFVIIIFLHYDFYFSHHGSCSSNSSRSGGATQYTIASQQIQLSVSGAGVDNTLLHTVTLLFTHSKNYSAVGEWILNRIVANFSRK